ncbi:integrase core domain-containing protein [bacterium]|nr:integrase core domain-containing protein [bacterium]
MERLWKTIKYERVYLYGYNSVGEARTSIKQYLAWYNQARPHSKLDMMKLDEAYGMMLPAVNLAA